MAQQQILLDNGAWKIKARLSQNPEQIVNCFNGIVRDKAKNQSHYCNKGFDLMHEGYETRTMNVVHPQVRGILRDSDLQSMIWRNVFSQVFDPKDKISDSKLIEKLSESQLLMTAQPCLPDFVSKRYAEMIFEDFQFQSWGMGTSHSMLYQASKLVEPQSDSGFYQSPASLVIDSGFSSTYGVPFFNGVPMKHAALRTDVGGKVLTNLLIETISHKDFNLKGEFGIVNDMKEKTSYFAPNQKSYYSDMEFCRGNIKRNPLLKEYVLPDSKKIKRGCIKTPELQIGPDNNIVKLAPERFQIPEVLFKPSDIGINEGGISDMIAQITSSRVPHTMEPVMLSNIVVGGGNTRIPGFGQRLRNEIEQGGRMTDLTGPINIIETEKNDNCDAALTGLQSFASQSEILKDYCISKEQYFEEGPRILHKFYL